MTSAFSEAMFCSVVNITLSSKLIPLALAPWALLLIWKAWIGGCIAVVALSSDWMGGTSTILLPPIQILLDQQECLRSWVLRVNLEFSIRVPCRTRAPVIWPVFQMDCGGQSTVPLLSCTVGFYFIDVLEVDDQISWAVAALSQRGRFERIRLSCVVCFFRNCWFNQVIWSNELFITLTNWCGNQSMHTCNDSHSWEDQVVWVPALD